MPVAASAAFCYNSDYEITTPQSGSKEKIGG